jgi:hypothetical protein
MLLSLIKWQIVIGARKDQDKVDGKSCLFKILFNNETIFDMNPIK